MAFRILFVLVLDSTSAFTIQKEVNQSFSQFIHR